MSIHILSGLYSLNFRVFEFNYFYLVVYTFWPHPEKFTLQRKVVWWWSGAGLLQLLYVCSTNSIV